MIAAGQSPMPEELQKNPAQQQITYIQGRTKIYDNYRAIREDMFQKLMGNLSDTLRVASEKIGELSNTVAALRGQVGALSASLDSARSGLDNAIRTKNSIRLAGQDVNKHAYNTLMWSMVLGIAILAVLAFMAFKRSNIVTGNTKKELSDLQNEFQTYKKSAREAREKMSMDHFNEIKRLRGG